MVVADTHTHSQFSDGAHSVEEVVERALQAGCTALAITDHGDASLTGSPGYLTEIKKQRARHPELILFAGLEWNIPPYNQREHVTLLLDPPLEEAILPEFKRYFDHSRGNEASAVTALQWLARRIDGEHKAVLLYNHPSRKDRGVYENFKDMQLWRTVNPLMVGFEGAPGHQRLPNIGAYSPQLPTEDRWDPVVAQVGGVWDRLLDQGETVWGALASSDFHNEGMDYDPCQYARTYVRVPEPTPEGVLRGLSAGAFWADHGRLLDQLDFSLSAPGLVLPAVPGEAVRLAPGAAMQLTIRLARGPGAGDIPLTLELISNARAGRPEIVESLALPVYQNEATIDFGAFKPAKDKDYYYFRLRVRKPIADAPDLMAYTNPIRVLTR